MDYAQVAESVGASKQGAALLERLTLGGPAVVDELRGDGGRGLDVDQPELAGAGGASDDRGEHRPAG